MKRIVCLIVFMAFSAPACARDAYFTFHGHRIHVSALRHCRSLSCVRASIPGLGFGRHNRDRDADVDAAPDRASPPAPVVAPAPAPAQPAPVRPPAPAPAQTPPAPAPAPVQIRPAPGLIQAQTPALTQAASASEQTRPLPPVIAQVPMMATRAPAAAAQGASAPMLAAAAAEPSLRPHLTQPSVKPETTASTPAGPPSVGFEVTRSPSAQPKAEPQVASTSDDSDDDHADTPLGDWQTDGKNGLVRIEACGDSLCGYVLNATTLAKGETILVNMKPKSAVTWSGNIFSRTSGNIYHGNITLKEPNTLWVEACALGKFICSGNDWTWIERAPREDKRVTSRPTPSRS